VCAVRLLRCQVSVGGNAAPVFPFRRDPRQGDPPTDERKRGEPTSRPLAPSAPVGRDAGRMGTPRPTRRRTASSRARRGSGCLPASVAGGGALNRHFAWPASPPELPHCGRHRRRSSSSRTSAGLGNDKSGPAGPATQPDRRGNCCCASCAVGKFASDTLGSAAIARDAINARAVRSRRTEDSGIEGRSLRKPAGLSPPRFLRQNSLTRSVSRLRAAASVWRPTRLPTDRPRPRPADPRRFSNSPIEPDKSLGCVTKAPQSARYIAR
jgi:hypothetical protein